MKLPKFIIFIIALPFILKFFTILLMRGGGDAWNFNSIYQYFANDEFGFFAPYFPASYVYVAFVGKLNDFFGFTYSFWQRITCLIFEIIGFIFTYKIAARLMDRERFKRSVILLAYSPIAFLVIGFHGNYDSIVFLLLILCAYTTINVEKQESRTSTEGFIYLVIATLIKPYAFVFLALYILLTKGTRIKIYYSLFFSLVIIINFIMLMDYEYIIRSFKTIIYYPHSSQAGWNSILKNTLSDNESIWIRRIYPLIAKLIEVLIVLSLCYVASMKKYWNIIFMFFMTSLIIVFLSGSIVIQYLYWIIPFGIFTNYLNLYIIYNIFGFIWIINYSLFLFCNDGVVSSVNQYIPYGHYSIDYIKLSKLIIEYSEYIQLIHNIVGNIILPIILTVWLFLEVRKSHFDKQKN